MGFAEDTALPHLRMAEERIFNFVGKDLHPVEVDHELRASHDGQAAVAVQRAIDIKRTSRICRSDSDATTTKINLSAVNNRNLF